MRLIDADLEIERICAICKKYGNNKLNKKMFSANDIMEILKNSPTAYDVEKVVEQLKEWSFEAEIVIPQSDGYDDTTTKEIICTQIAIEIVKEGGTE